MGAPARVWWGWHRLSPEWARRLVDAAEVDRGDVVLDIGAGTGAITACLLAAGAHVVAVELHPGRAAQLRARFGPAGVRVVETDASDLRLPRRPFRVVANLPFAVTTAVLHRLLHPSSQLVHAELVVPRHVAARWSGGRGERRPRSVVAFDIEHRGRIPRSAFDPPAPTDAAHLSVIRRGPPPRRSARPGTNGR